MYIIVLCVCDISAICLITFRPWRDQLVPNLYLEGLKNLKFHFIKNAPSINNSGH